MKQFTADNINLKYIILGKGAPLLFLHGGGLNALSYKKSIDLLSKKYQVIAPDIPCFGKSTVPRDLWDFEDFADFFSQFIDSLGVDEIVVVGHSFGGGVALALASKNKKISKIILADTAGVAPNYSPLKLIFLLVRKTFLGFLIYKNKTISLLMVRDFFRGIFKNFFAIKRIWKIFIKSIYKEYHFFGKITQPTFIVWGNSDEIFPKENAQRINQLVKDSKIEYVSGNHDWPLLMPDSFFSLIYKASEQNTT